MKKLWASDDRIMGFLIAGIVYLGVAFIGDVKAGMAKSTEHDTTLALHDQEIKLLSAMRPQVQDILIKMDSVDKSVREMRERTCFFQPKHRGE